MQKGTITGINPNGFGFIKIEGAQDGDKDLFFHANELVNVRIDDLQPGDMLEFDVEPSKKDPTKQNAVRVSKV